MGKTFTSHRAEAEILQKMILAVFDAFDLTPVEKLRILRRLAEDIYERHKQDKGFLAEIRRQPKPWN
jgi:hypothetical protein